MVGDPEPSDVPLRFPGLTNSVTAVERGFVGLRVWWHQWWLRLSILVLAIVVWVLLSLWWFVGERSDSDGSNLISFFDSLVGIASVFLGGAVTIATAYSAGRVADTVALTREREEADRIERKKGRVEALVGASLEAATYGLWMAEIQRRGLKTWRRFIPESEVQRQFAIVSWRQLSAATVAASKALERLRYEHPDLAALAGGHFDLVVELQQAAFEGDSEYLHASAQKIRESADKLWDNVAAG